ncbi:hypothetical protein Pint_32753 [Pistacia integerrima]|uniref:Uncharacterized protein n=1 Tax=Pistacia integerrima TaxID=434235 RepID=A0ACC0XRS0_9ROSI|nr:hypothetical protein Pint_32753 [Pistacia integerrima]
MAAALRSVYVWMLFNLFFIFLCFSQNENEFIYNNGFQGAKLLLGEFSEIHPNGLLQLTNTSGRQTGHAFYPSPFKFNTSSPETLSFSTKFVFAIVPQSVNIGGHGMAFVISPSTNFTGGDAGRYLGLFNLTNNGQPTNHILAIEFDTVQSRTAYDIDNNHVGIDVNGLVSNDSATATYCSDEEGKNKSLELMSGDPIQVWIDYDGAEKLLDVTLSPNGIAKPKTPLLSTPLNLSEVLLDSMYVGFSAATGKITSDHYVLGWSFNRSGQAQNLDVSKLPPVPAHGKASKKPGPLMIVLVVVAVAVAVLLIVLIVAAYIVWRKKYEEVYEDWEREYGPQRFPYKNLYKATKGFKDIELIGKGGFGKVYRGVLPSNEQIAVKRVSHGSNQGMKEFVAEIISMGKLRHRNLVQLRGYCRRKGEFILATTSTDVFAFGAFMLEVACGRRPIEQQGYGVVYLVEWIINCWKRGAILEVSDPRLEGIYAEEQMELILKLGLFCSHPNPPVRPNMRQVMQYLDGDATLPDISPDSSSIDVFITRNETSNSVMSLPSLFESNSDSILTEGR